MATTMTSIKRRMTSEHLTHGSASDYVNVGSLERWACIGGGALLTLYGLTRANLLGLGLAALGGGLMYRGFSGHCPAYGALGINTDQHNPLSAMPAGQGVKVEQSIHIQRRPAELYEIWSNLENLPRIMSHLVSVRSEGDRSHWVACAPAGMTVEWEAEIINQVPGHLIAWRSLEGSQVATAGSVHFEPLPEDRGSYVHINLKYDPPARKLGSWLAWLFGEEPSQQIREDLRRFKQSVEAGELAGV